MPDAAHILDAVDQVEAAGLLGPREIPLASIENPPCSTCQHFAPAVSTDRRGRQIHIQICRAPHIQQPDFSCHDQRPDAGDIVILNPFALFANFLADKVLEQLMPKIADLQARIAQSTAKLDAKNVEIATEIAALRASQTDPVPQSAIDAFDVLDAKIDAIGKEEEKPDPIPEVPSEPETPAEPVNPEPTPETPAEPAPPETPVEPPAA